MKKYLRCVQGGSSFTAGKRYEIVGDGMSSYSVRNDVGAVEFFTKKPDDHGFSYRDWFTLETEEDAQITVLPDESLGGVLREYRGVKRKADVGELAKITDNISGHRFPLGEVVRVTAHEGNDTAEYLDGRDYWYVDFEDYVVLEPSDILVIDGARYRMVDRKAAVGERVIITNAEPGYGYEQGGVYEIMTLDCDDPCIWPDGTDQSEIYLEQQEYRVLEPINSAAAPQLSELPASDQIAENIAALAARVSGLEAKVAELGEAVRAVIEAGNPAKLSVSTADAKSLVDTTTKKSPQQIRDEIVERAKADVKTLLDTPSPIGHDIEALDGAYINYHPHNHRVEFVVNRDKRTVVALVWHRRTDKLRLRGIAKCAPNDVFNTHIGRAIALRRALGLEVPAEYLSVPNPEEPRIGDVITYDVLAENTEYVVELHNGRIAVRITKSAYPKNVGALIMCGKDGVDGAIILDDSRISEAENNAADRKEVAA